MIVDSLAHVTGVLIVALLVFVTLRYADRIIRRLGPTGTAVLLRLSAFILLCIGVQILWNGASALWRTLACRRRAHAGRSGGSAIMQSFVPV